MDRSSTTITTGRIVRQPDVARIRDYYDQTWLDYRLLWLRPENGAIHFGYWDNQTRDHVTSLLTLNRVLVKRLDLKRGARVLDAGCGIGGRAIESLCHALEKSRFFTEAQRLLRPPSRLLVAVYMRGARPLAPPDEALLHGWLSGWAIAGIATRDELAG